MDLLETTDIIHDLSTNPTHVSEQIMYLFVTEADSIVFSLSPEY